MEIKADRHVGTRIKKLRVENELSQRQLSTDRISYAYISRIEAGQRTPSLSALIELASTLGVSALYLATGRERDCPFCRR